MVLGETVLASIAMIEATHAARMGRPISFAYGLALLTPIVDDIRKLALSCLTSAANYESVENLLTPAFLKEFESVAPELARLVAAVGLGLDRALGGGETPVVATLAGSATVAAAASVPALLGRLQRASVSQQILVETGQGATGRRFTLYLPGTQYWSPVGSTKAFDLTSDLAAFAKPGFSAPERAAVQALKAQGFGGIPGDSVTVVGYSEGGIVGANLVSSGALTNLGGKVSGLVTVASPISAANLPEQTRVISIEHVDDPVPKLDLATNPKTTNWTTLKLKPEWLDTHELSSYQKDVVQLGEKRHSQLSQALAAMTGGHTTGSATLTGYTASRIGG